MQRGRKLLLGGAVVAVFVVLLFSQSMQSSYLSPVPPAELPQEGSDDAVSVIGNVSSPEFDANNNVLKFRLEGGGDSVPVVYSEGPPSNFGEDKKVKAVGTWDGETFHADKLVVKCPSKYEGKSPEDS